MVGRFLACRRGSCSEEEVTVGVVFLWQSSSFFPLHGVACLASLLFLHAVYVYLLALSFFNRMDGGCFSFRWGPVVVWKLFAC
jgi:hypothetical protein